MRDVVFFLRVTHFFLPEVNRKLSVLRLRTIAFFPLCARHLLLQNVPQRTEFLIYYTIPL